VPNERLAQSSVLNHTILDPRVQVEELRLRWLRELREHSLSSTEA
jgi:hypothetical protein